MSILFRYGLVSKQHPQELDGDQPGELSAHYLILACSVIVLLYLEFLDLQKSTRHTGFHILR